MSDLSSSSSVIASDSLKAAQLRAVYRMLAFNDESASSAAGGGGGGGAAMMGGAASAAAMGAGGSEMDDASLSYQLPPPGSSHNSWKILVYDAPCQRIISPLLSVQQLRRRGVTLHLLLHGDREPIPDVPAVYFCRPTRENLARIARDCSQSLYGRFHINLVTRIDRPLLEEFAKLVVQSGSLSSVASIHDQYLDYVVLERNLFSLSIQDSYRLYNGSSATEAQMESAMNDVALGLFSVVASLGQVPIIRCPKGGAPEMVARKLHRLVAEHPALVRSKPAASASRPLLVILDRNADLITPLQHTSTYQALVDDVLRHSANRVEFQQAAADGASSQAAGGSKPPKAVQKRYDLDPDDDPFYGAQKFQPFPEAIESNGSELQQVTAREQEIRSSSGGGGGGAGAGSSSGPGYSGDGAGAAGSLALAVESLPALLERKRQLEVHTSILQAVMNQVAARDIPNYYELESALATGSYKGDPAKAKRDVVALIAGGADGAPAAISKGTVEDKVRLVVVWMLATGAKSSDVEEVTGALQESVQGNPGSTADDNRSLVSGLRALSYLKQLRSTQMLPSAADMLQTQLPSTPSSSGRPGSGSAAAAGGGAESSLSLLMAKATTQATGLLAKATDKVISSMLGRIHKHHATQVVENLCEFRGEDEAYLYLDPRARGDVDVSRLRAAAAAGMAGGGHRAPVRRAVVFVIGGGCYGEYQNLQLIAGPGSDGRGRRQVVYGSTEIVNSTAFLQQLGQLGG